MQRNVGGKKGELLRKWIPFLIGIYRGGSAVPGIPGRVVAMMHDREIPLSPSTIDRELVSVRCGGLEVSFLSPELSLFLSAGTIDLEEITIQFDDGNLLPKITGVPGGLRLDWTHKPRIIGGGVAKLFTTVLGTRIDTIHLYPDKAEVAVIGWRDLTLTWEPE